MKDHSHDNVKTLGGVAVIASVPTHAATWIDGVAFAPPRVAVTAGATITFTTAGVHEHDGSLHLLMVGTIVLEAATGSDVPR